MRDEILAHAVQLASVEGLESLTIGRLAEALSMSKSGLFGHFGSKQGLQLAVLERAAEVFGERVRKVGRRFPAGLERLLALVEAWLVYVEERDFEGGCFFAAASAEFDGRPGPVRDALARLARAWIAALEAEIQKARARGELGSDTDVGQLVFELHAAVQEANWSFQLFGNAQALAHARHAIRECVKRAVTTRGRELCDRVNGSLSADVRSARPATEAADDPGVSHPAVPPRAERPQTLTAVRAGSIVANPSS
jgi:AcrR family transcriptional regulator